MPSTLRGVWLSPPLIRQAAIDRVDQTLNPAFKNSPRGLCRHAASPGLDIASVPATLWGDRIGSLEHDSDRIIGELDPLLARY